MPKGPSISIKPKGAPANAKSVQVFKQAPSQIRKARPGEVGNVGFV